VNARAQHVPVAEAAAGHQPVEVLQREPAFQQVRHVHVDRGEPGPIERGRHLDLAVDTLLAQHRHPRPGTAGNHRRSDVVRRIEAEVPGEPGVGRVDP
jgi:hypothetical protein